VATLKLFIFQCLMGCMALSLLTSPVGAQEKPSLPDPVKFINKYEVVFNVVRWALKDKMGLDIELEDRKGGKIITRPEEFITGSLTASEVQKVAVKTDALAGSWMKARYVAEAILEPVSTTETLVTIRTRIEALNRDMNGTEKWMPLDSLGVFEKRILGNITMKLMGSEMQFDQKKGFWDRKPEPVDPRKKSPVMD
jgi:hypothetical protein